MKFPPPNPERNKLQHHAVTIDGTAGSGKGTLATRISEKYKIKFLDTGTIYRTVVYAALKNNIALTDTFAVAKMAKTLNFDFKHLGNNQFATFLDGENIEDKIRLPEVDKGLPLTAPQAEIRAALLQRQIKFVAEWTPMYGVLLDGRDCGARIAPEATIKFFITGDARVRAERRQKQLAARGIDVSLDELHADMTFRDERDAPNTIQTADAHVLDCCNMNAEEVFAAAVKIIEEAVPNAKE